MPTPTEFLNESQANTGDAATGNQSKPQIIGLSNGNILVAWEDDSLGVIGGTGDTDIIGKIFSSTGAVVVDSFRLNSSRNIDNERDFSIAATNDGGFIIAYVDNDISSPNNSDLVFERKNASGGQIAFGTIFSETSATITVVDPSIAVNLSDNSFLVTWTTNDSGNANVRGRHFSSTNVGGPEFAAGQSGVDDDRDSDTVILTNGNFVTVYEEVDTGVTGAEFKINTSAGGFVANSNISTGSNADPVAASLANGNWVAVWNDADTGNGDIVFQIFTAAGAAVTGTIPAASGAIFQNEPIVVALPDGGFVIAWDNDTDSTLEARAFTAAGVADGSTVVISPVAVTRPAASVTADGRVAFAWLTEPSFEIFWSIWDPRGGVINFNNYNQNLVNFHDTGTVVVSNVANTITGTIDDDTINGGSANDTINGGSGNDTITGGAGIDSLNGSSNDDTFIYLNNHEIDNVNGDAGNDTLDFSAVTLAGQGVNINFNTNTITGFGGAGTVTSIETVLGTQLNDVIVANAGGDNLHGNGGDDTLEGGFGEDNIFGDAGNDTIIVRAGEFLDNVDGGTGTDTYDVSALSALDYSGATIDFASGLITTTFAADGSVTITGIEIYRDGEGGNTILDLFFDLTIFAGGGNDTVIENSLGGNDRFDLGSGNDVLVINNTGIGGGDVFDGGNDIDRIDYSAITFAAGDLVVIDLSVGRISNGLGGQEDILNFENVIGSQGVETIIGTADANLLDGQAENDTINGLGGNDTLIGGEGNDLINGGDANDTISGGNGNDTLNGDSGNDTFDGGAGNDRMTGGPGNDIYLNVATGDIVIEAVNGGSDTVRTTLNSYVLPANVERVDFIGVGNFVGIGNGGNNRFTGGTGDDRFVDVISGVDIFSGGTGSDSVDFRTSATGVIINLLTGTHGGAAVDDTYASIEKFFGSNTDVDIMIGGVGRANFSGFGGNDILTGGNNIDALQGNAGDDVLDGLGGVDALDGGAGNDTLTGGTGNDNFVYSAAGFGQDVITDFQDGADKLKVHSSIATNITFFNITGNGTTSVVLTQIAAPTNTITLQGASAITISSADFIFY
jgi:Ca2+-binding RTX toxin-like protein